MGMNEGVLPDFRSKNDKSVEEERNNAYVAVTRAKKCIYVTYPNNKTMPLGSGNRAKTVSRFIEGFAPALHSFS
jgi:DNA helicase II / ATP-dependent DNA helicase PcrA